MVLLTVNISLLLSISFFGVDAIHFLCTPGNVMYKMAQSENGTSFHMSEDQTSKQRQVFYEGRNNTGNTKP